MVATWPVRSTPISTWRWLQTTNPYSDRLPETTEQFDDSSWPAHNIVSESGPLNARQHGVFRSQFRVSEQDLSSGAIEINFGMIDEDGWVYVNGQRVGESHDWQTASIFDVKRFLRAGENKVAVVVANYDGAGGVNKSASLQFQEPPRLPVWKRSVFNGLAQIIVQSSKDAGEIKLTASSPGLQPATVVIRSEPGAIRAAIP
jgi:beta-galactosidase